LLLILPLGAYEVKKRNGDIVEVVGFSWRKTQDGEKT